MDEGHGDPERFCAACGYCLCESCQQFDEASCAEFDALPLWRRMWRCVRVGCWRDALHEARLALAERGRR